MKLKSLLLAAGLACTAAAQANDYFLNDITGVIPTTVPSFTHGTGSFTDYFFFSLSKTSVASGTIANIEVGGWPFGGDVFNIKGLSTYLYTDTGTVGKTDGTESGFLLGTGDFIHPTGQLDAGNYFIKITGNAVGGAGGMYVASISAQPVPEPDTYAMMIAGLGLVAGIARRKSRK